ncbi:MAG: sulfatase-like hydrolase/transferase, partial [Bacteroidales bacterium]|nr:sulfatase-like hydrolase/transferase [Bacteroidales bacterium]
MKYLSLYIILIPAFALFSCSGEPGKNEKPNIIYILADDLGYGETGAYGQEKIETPALDKLAESGMRFTQHYSGSPVCAPSRCVLLTGKHSGHAFIRGNHEWGERGNVWSYIEMINNPELEGQYPLPEGTVTIGSLLQEAGYKTAIVGKWGLGAPGSTGIPNKQGFDLFFGYNCQRQAHTYNPVHLWKNTERIFTGNDTVPPHTGLPEGADPYDESS